jgi:hypothetical protein
MGLVSQSSWRQCCRKTTKTEHKKLLQQAANCSFTVSLSIIGFFLFMLLQISAAAGATRMSTEAQTSGEGAAAAPVMQLTHRMAGLEGSKAMREEGTGMTMEHYNRLLEHDKLRFKSIMMQQKQQQQQMMRGRQDFEVVDFTLNGNFNADGYIQIQTLIISASSSSSSSSSLHHLFFFFIFSSSFTRLPSATDFKLPSHPTSFVQLILQFVVS